MFGIAKENKNPIEAEKEDVRMEAYTDFAEVYDTFMDETPYEEWCEFLIQLLEEYKVPKGRILLDLGCGTGTLTQMLSKEGYDMIGVDNSGQMLAVAMEKREVSGENILYLLQDMRGFELFGTVSAVISVCDSLNYLLEEEDLIQTFRLVNNYLDPGGVFIFDFNTVYKYQEVIGDATIAENREECSFIWENYYHEEQEINEYDLTVFVREKDGLFRKFEENHFQRGYCQEQIQQALEKAGMEFVKAIDAETHKEVTEISERIYCVAREKGKQKK